MKKLSLALSLAFGATALADVPALINYQGRLVDGVGNPIVGKKEFKLDIYDSQTEGTLIYQETLPDITLDEDGAYSFQFGAGESRSETSVLVATGDGEAAFFQKVFEETPVGVISVTDGTNTFKTGDAPTGDEPFSFTYTASLKRLNLVCNEPPAVDTNFIATFRYAEGGILGALSSSDEHWMGVTIGGEKQEPRQRLVAVPFALRAGEAANVKEKKVFRSFLSRVDLDYWDRSTSGAGFGVPPILRNAFRVHPNAHGIVKIVVRANKPNTNAWTWIRVIRVPIDEYEKSALNEDLEVNVKEIWKAEKLLDSDPIFDPNASVSFLEDPDNPTGYQNIEIKFEEPIQLSPDYQYFVEFDVGRAAGNGGRGGIVTSSMVKLSFLE